MAKNKANNSPDPLNAGWLKWLVIAFLVYSVFSTFNRDKNLAEQDFNQSETGRRIGSSVTIAGNGVQYGTKLSLKNMSIGGEIAGQGETVQCGEVATVKVSATFDDGRPYLEQKGDTPITVSVGTLDDKNPWIAGIMGMSSGGVRELIVPVKHFIDSAKRDELNITENDNVHFKVSLEQATPTISPQKLPFRALEIESGKGMHAYCGAKVKAHIDIWGIDGNKIFTSRMGEHKGEIALTIGESSIFYGLDRGILGMRIGGRRSITVPVEYLQSSKELKKLLNKESISDSSSAYKYIKDILPKDQIAIVDISLMSVEE